MSEGPVRVSLSKQQKAIEWVRKHCSPMIASLASQGEVDGAEALEILDGIDGLVGLVKFVRKHESQIKQNARENGPASDCLGSWSCRRLAHDYRSSAHSAPVAPGT
jgi:hypothetical protein